VYAPCIKAMALPRLFQLDPPDTLVFSKSKNVQTPSRTLRITNTHTGNVAFKVKTTAPKSYLVRPSSGTVKPGENLSVQIIFQGSGADNNLAVHRFLVQGIAVQSSEQQSREDWNNFAKEDIQEQRLNVALENGGEPEPENVMEVDKGGGAEGTSDLQVKYDELVQYTLMLEKEKKRLESDILSLKGSNQGSNSRVTGLTVILTALIAFSVSYFSA